MTSSPSPQTRAPTFRSASLTGSSRSGDVACMSTTRRGSSHHCRGHPPRATVARRCTTRSPPALCASAWRSSSCPQRLQHQWTGTVRRHGRKTLVALPTWTGLARSRPRLRQRHRRGSMTALGLGARTRRRRRLRSLWLLRGSRRRSNRCRMRRSRPATVPPRRTSCRQAASRAVSGPRMPPSAAWPQGHRSCRGARERHRRQGLAQSAVPPCAPRL
mmetsp:Transcript_83145/g.178248  ORF Transcript_83145/g.178248 Transcript_83145/m.178248 type:complete len:217 (-) Transcript_83145:244-894(-)